MVQVLPAMCFQCAGLMGCAFASLVMFWDDDRGCVHETLQTCAGVSRPEMLHPWLANAGPPLFGPPELRGLMLVGDLSAYAPRAAVPGRAPPPRLTSHFGYLPVPTHEAAAGE